MSQDADVLALADACAAKAPASATADAAMLTPEFEALLQRLRALGPEFGFDRDGRPGAIRAVREALPLMEREIFDAIVDDHACELAAVSEAMFQVARAAARRAAGG